nr:uncharacterized protein LOC122268301 [Parasteatoda tepidariorum]
MLFSDHPQGCFPDPRHSLLCNKKEKVMEENEDKRKGKENKTPSNPEMNPKDEIKHSISTEETIDTKEKESNVSLPLLPGTPTPDVLTKSYTVENRQHSPVRFPTLFIPAQDKM